jgi:hypothetical protein
MSKITYCSLEEAWGKTYKDESKDISKDTSKERFNNIQDDKKYNNLVEKSDSDRVNVINNLNAIEKNVPTQNNSIVEYNRYRFNPDNNVKSSENQLTYSPFNESLEKKYLKDKLFFLENEFRKYKTLFDQSDSYNQQQMPQSYGNEHFSNNNSSSVNNNKSNNTNDMIDLILLIIIGLIIILVMNSIFSIGKSIGSRQQRMT